MVTEVIPILGDFSSVVALQRCSVSSPLSAKGLHLQLHLTAADVEGGLRGGCECAGSRSVRPSGATTDQGLKLKAI